jgi:uncharacterized protein (DUF2147 family)
MRTFIPRAALALSTIVALSGAARAAEPTGTWLRDNGNAQVRVAACGGALCGVIAWVKDPSGPGKVGQRVFYSMVPDGNGGWSGQAFNPEDGRTYSGTMTVSGNHLKTAGCVLGGLICKSVGWSRVK